MIRAENVRIDVAFWFMEDFRYVQELANRRAANVDIRIIVDRRSYTNHLPNKTYVEFLANDGHWLREKYVGDILHFKMMAFHGLKRVQFSKANYTPSSFVPDKANENYIDEAVMFTDDPDIVNSFFKRFDDLWVNTSSFRNLANDHGRALIRECPTCITIHPSMNFPPLQDFSNRSVGRYNAEISKTNGAQPRGIDAITFRVTDDRHANAMIKAVANGVPVRLISDPGQYRHPDHPFVSKHIDRMWAGGVDIKMKKRGGIMHQASVVMHALGEVIFGSSNWTTASASRQDEHNFFYSPATTGGEVKDWFYQWFATQFNRKWDDALNYYTFQPLPPGTPTNIAPANASSGVSTTAELRWDGGTWAHLFDIRLAPVHVPLTDPAATVVSNFEFTHCAETGQRAPCGNPRAGEIERFPLTNFNLQPGTSYHWQIVGKTFAGLAKLGPVWSFTTAGTTPGGGGGGPTPYYPNAPAPVPGTFQAEDFDRGGQNVAFSDTTSTNSGATYRPQEAVDIEASAGGGFNVGWTKPGEWLIYTVNVATTGTYQLDARVANLGTGAQFYVEVDGVDRTGMIPVPNTTGWQTWGATAKRNIALTAGVRVLRVVFATGNTSGGTGNVGNFDWFRLTTGASTPPTYSGTPYGGTAAVLPGIVHAENFDVGAQGVAHSDTSTGNAGGVYRADATNADVGANTDADADNRGFHLGWTRVGEWVKYTVNVTASGAYNVSVRVANAGSGAQFRLEVDGQPLTGLITLDHDTGGWDVWETIPIGTVNLNQGTRVIRLVMVRQNTQNNGVGNFGYIRFE